MDRHICVVLRIGKLQGGAPTTEGSRAREGLGGGRRVRRGERPHVDRIHSRVGGVVRGRTDAQLDDAVEEREAVRVLNGEAAGGKHAVEAVWVGTYLGMCLLRYTWVEGRKT